jgi:hypothetical protein
VHVAIPSDQKHPNQWVQQQIRDLVQVGGDQSMNVLADIMIVDVAQLLHFKAVMDHDNDLSK